MNAQQVIDDLLKMVTIYNVDLDINGGKKTRIYQTPLMVERKQIIRYAKAHGLQTNKESK